jgi:DEAD/DEAH box helicase domain-containing protein
MSRNLAAASGVSGLAGLIEELRRDARLGPQMAHVAHLPAEAARWGELDPALPAAVGGALGRAGVERLWWHQAEGIAAVRRGENVLVTTPTASGKSLVFQLPALEEAMRGGPGRGLFLFPLKALGQDQRAKFQRLAAESGLSADEAGCEIYDGDTPPARRAAIRKRFPRVVVSNPDMVHHAVLGHWTGWGPFLADLSWIVLDELHTYRGIFGSHFHHVLQRLLRLCRAVGGNPLLIASSATAANAGAFAETLTGRSFRWIAESGAPREGRHLLLVRPQTSAYTTALQLLVRFLAAGLKTIVFTKARRITELLYSWLRRQEPALAARVASYRAGFLPEERRRIERALFEGSLDGVISTSALEMGIDVGGLDACILVGFPGSMMATWQRSGRVGRAGKESVTVLVAMPDALDQYFLAHPEQLLGRPCERLIVDPGNEPVSRGHLVCAAAEMPLTPAADRVYLDGHRREVAKLLSQGHLLEAPETGELFSLRRRPQRFVNLRGTGETFAIHDESGAVIGTVDGVRVFHECHPGAVYLHAGRQFLVEQLDREERRVRVVAADVDYFTTPLTEKETEVLEVLARRGPLPTPGDPILTARPLPRDGISTPGDLISTPGSLPRRGALRARLGRLKVTERVVGFERKRIHGQETIDQTPLELPPVEFETVGLWWEAPRSFEETLRQAGEHFLGSLHACEHAAISLFPLLALCDRGDIGGISYRFHPQVGCGAVFIYDGHAGGVGIAARGFEELEILLEQVLSLLAACPCEEGCPSCVQSPKCGNGNRPLDKAGAARVLRLLLGLEEAAAPALPEVAETGPAALPGPEAALDIEPWEVWPRAPAIVVRRDTVLFDLETLRSAADVGGWRHCHRMGIAVGVVCHLEEGRFEVFPESGVRELAASLRAATLVIGFNSKRFDYQVLSGYTGDDYGRLLPSLDLLDDLYRRFGFRLGLGHLALETLGVPKSANGLQSLEWVRQGKLDLVTDYCRRDVEILRDLYLHGRRQGYLFYRDTRRDVRLKLPVEW